MKARLGNGPRFLFYNRWMQDFFDYLEYSISRTLANSADSNKRRYWCDGIMLPEIGDCYALQQNDSATKQNERFWIAARAWIDTGNSKNKLANQGICELKVVLGKQALAAYQAGQDLKRCIPSEQKDDWIKLDISAGVITVFLL